MKGIVFAGGSGIRHSLTKGVSKQLLTLAEELSKTSYGKYLKNRVLR